MKDEICSLQSAKHKGEKALEENVVMDMFLVQGHRDLWDLDRQYFINNRYCINYYLHNALLECYNTEFYVGEVDLFNDAYWIALDVINKNDGSELPLDDYYYKASGAEEVPFLDTPLISDPFREELVMMMVKWLLYAYINSGIHVEAMIQRIKNRYRSPKTEFNECVVRLLNPDGQTAPADNMEQLSVGDGELFLTPGSISSTHKKGGRKQEVLFINEETEESCRTQFVDFLKMHKSWSTECSASSNDFKFRHLTCFLRLWQRRGLIQSKADGNLSFSACARFLQSCIPNPSIEFKSIENTIRRSFGNRCDVEDEARFEAFLNSTEEQVE